MILHNKNVAVISAVNDALKRLGTFNNIIPYFEHKHSCRHVVRGTDTFLEFSDLKKLEIFLLRYS